MTDEAIARYRIVNTPNRAHQYRVDHRAPDGSWSRLGHALSQDIAHDVIAEHKRRLEHGEQEHVVAYVN